METEVNITEKKRNKEENRLVSVKEIDNSWVKISRLEFRSKEEQEEEMRKKWHIKHGDLKLEKNTTFEGSLVVRGNITGNFDLRVRGDLIAEDIDVRNLDAYNITARDITACIIDAYDITAYNIDAHHIDAKSLIYNMLTCSNNSDR